MTAINWDIGVVVGVQSARGTINDTIRDLNMGDGAGTAGALAVADGIVLGDPTVGIGESGIDLKFTRSLKEKATLSNFTLQASDFLATAIEGLTIGFPLKGNGGTASSPPVDGDMVLHAGIDALLQGLSLTPAAWGSGVGRIYTPAAMKYLTIKLFLGSRTSDSVGLAYVFQDCVASGSIEFTPAGIGVVTCNLAVGSVPDFAGGWPDFEETFPTFEYGTQSTLSAPVVQGVAHAWGATRGFETFTLNIDNAVEEANDSNSSNGKIQRVTGRTVSATATLYSDDTDLDFETQELIATTAPTDLMSFTVGDAATNGSTVNAYSVRLTTPELRGLKPARLGDELGWEVEVVGVNGTANNDFSLIFI